MTAAMLNSAALIMSAPAVQAFAVSGLGAWVIGTALASGVAVGLVLGLIGGGGSVLAVPLLVYVVGISDVHVVIGTSSIAVALNALASLGAHARAGTVKWNCAIAFTIAGIAGAGLGAHLGKAFDGQKLLALFGLVMIVVGLNMLRGRDGGEVREVRLTRATAGAMLPWLIGTGLGVGLLSGFFGIGGGFLIVPGLMLATGMPLPNAVGTSLFAVTAFGLTTATSYAVSGLVDWRLAALVVAGGVAGSLAGTKLSVSLGRRKRALSYVFAAVVIGVGFYVVSRGIGILF